MTSTHPIDRSTERHTATQWFALLFAPIVFLVHLEIAYTAVSWACTQRSSLVLYCITGLAVVLAAWGTRMGWQLMQRLRTPHERQVNAHGRPRFLAFTGVLVSAMSTLVLLAQLMAELFLSPCQ